MNLNIFLLFHTTELHSVIISKILSKFDFLLLWRGSGKKVQAKKRKYAVH